MDMQTLVAALHALPRIADSMEKIAAIVEAHSSAPVGTAKPEPAKADKPKAEKPKAEPAKVEAVKAEPDASLLEQVKERVRTIVKDKGREAAVGLLARFKAKTAFDLAPDHYQDFLDVAANVLEA